MNKLLEEIKFDVESLKDQINKFDIDKYYRDAGLSKNQQEIFTHSNNWLRMHGKSSCPRSIRKKIKEKLIHYNNEKFFGIVEETINRLIVSPINNDEFFNQFVDLRSIE